nr:MAG TPA: hypothetical protein [Caudoviricetes sp.]
MERLTEYESVGGHAHAVPTDNIDTALMRLAAYEDTGLTPGDIKELLDMAVSKTDKVLRLKEELHAMKNELCQYCGKYKQAHEGACDGCRWREM